MLPKATVLLVAALPAFCADWNPRLAAEYLDSRQKAWFAWPAATAQGGPCISCHTGITYLLARPKLARVLGESQPTPYEKGLLSGLQTRVDQKTPKEFSPKRKEPSASQALGVESIFAALFLAQQAVESETLSPQAEQAFDRMWSLQIRDGSAKGAWSWFELSLDPWETTDSPFYGASLAALAAGAAPTGYRGRPEIRERLAALTAYLRREQPAQPLHNRLTLLWASTKLPDAMPESARQSLITEILGKQQPDGGWTAESLGPWKQHPQAPKSAGSNSYATAFVTFVLERAGVARSNPKLIRALDWLRAHQDRRFGFWAADSMNKHYESGSMPELFMRDAATGFATLALLDAGDLPRK